MSEKLLKRSQLYKHQIITYKHIIDNSHAGVMLEMGLGKTAATLTAINDLIFNEFEIDTVLVVAPKRVVESVWVQETQKWEHLKHLKCSRIIGTPKQRIAAIKVKANIYIISRDNLAWLCGLYGGRMLPFDMLVVDESSSFKNPKSVRTKAIMRVLFDRVVILTGTPISNGLLDLWSQVYLLDRGQRLGKFIGQYRAAYFKPKTMIGGVVRSYKLVSPDNEKLIHDKISDICISMKKEDWLNLPEKIYNNIYIDFPTKLMTKYNNFEKDLVLDLLDNANGDENQISVVNAAALTNKLLQFANGAVYDEEREWHEIHDLKIKALEELIEANEGKSILIAWTYRHDKERLEKALAKYKPRSFKTDKDVTEWNMGKIHIMMSHPASIGHGLNLQHGGHICVWFGQTWSLELYQQFNDRLHRPGQKERVFIHHLVSRGTMDADVLKAQDSKAKTQNNLMTAVKAKIKKYLK